MKFWNQIPLFRILLPFVFGILMFPILKAELSIQSFWIVFSILLALSLLMLLRRKTYSSRWVFGFMMNAALLLLGLFYVSQFHQKQSEVKLPTQRSIEYLAKVSEIIKQTDSTSQSIVTLNTIRQDEKLETVEAKVLLYIKDSMKLFVGDVLALSTYFNRIKSTQNPGSFDYAQYMGNKGVYYQAYTEKVRIVGHKQSITAFAGKMRRQLIHNYELMGFQGENLAVLVAITLGDKSYLEKGLKNQYAQAGAMHILAVSGLHLGIIFLLFTFLLSPLLRLPSGKFIQGVLQLVVLWSFAMLTGFAPSVQRAAIMFSFVVIAKMLHYNSNTLNSIFGSALLILLINPLMVFELGFQLSYAAVIGIVWLHPIVYNLFTVPYSIVDKIWSLLVVSIAAQLATLPLVLYYFHQFPNWFLLTNLLIIPLAFFIVAAAVIAVFLYAMFTFSFGINLIVGVSLSVLNFIIKSLNQLPFFISSEIWISPFSAMLIGMAILVLFVFLEKVQIVYLKLSLSCIIMVLLIEFSINFRQRYKSSFGIYAFKGESAYVYVDGLEAVLYYDNSLSEYSWENIRAHLHKMGIRKISKSSLLLNTINDNYCCLNTENYILFSFGDKLILFSKKTNIKFLKTMEFFDYLIINQFNRFHFDRENKKVNNIIVVLDGSVLSWTKAYAGLEKVENFHFVNREGYFEIN